MATLAINNPALYGSNLPGVSPWLRGDAQKTGSENYFKETAGQTWTVNDFIYLDANGTLAIATTMGNNLNSAVAAIAEYPASGVTGAPVLVRALRKDDILVMNVFHTTPSSAVTAQTQLGAVFPIINSVAAPAAGTGGKWCVDIQTAAFEDATHALAKVICVGFYQGSTNTNDAPSKPVISTIGDVYGLILVKFVDFTVQSTGAGLVRNLQLS